jgi:hypothetical protein
MTRQASSKTSDFTASPGFKAEVQPFGIHHSSFVLLSALPVQLFYSTQIPVCLWFLTKNKNAGAKRGLRFKSGTIDEVRRKPDASPVSTQKSPRYIKPSTARRHENPLVQKSAISTTQCE